MDLFIIVVLLLALLSPILSVVLFKKTIKYREEMSVLASSRLC